MLATGSGVGLIRTVRSAGLHLAWHGHPTRVDVTYRPLRIGWALTGQDIEACLYAALLNYTLWGGRFNPLLPVDRPAFARQLVDAFRVDVETPVLAVGLAPLGTYANIPDCG